MLVLGMDTEPISSEFEGITKRLQQGLPQLCQNFRIRQGSGKVVMNSSGVPGGKPARIEAILTTLAKELDFSTAASPRRMETLRSSGHAHSKFPGSSPTSQSFLSLSGGESPTADHPAVRARARSTGSKPLWVLLSESCDKFLSKTTGDVATHYRSLLESEVLPSDSSLMRLLTVLSTETAWPAIREMRERIYPHVRYKDAKGTWACQVIFHDFSIEVVLSKTERSHLPEEEHFFEFDWAVRLWFDLNITELLSADWMIVDFTFHVNTSQARRREVMQCILPFLKPSLAEAAAQSKNSGGTWTAASLSVSEILDSLRAGLVSAQANPICRLPDGEHHTVPALRLLNSLEQALVNNTVAAMPPVYVPVRNPNFSMSSKTRLSYSSATL